MTGNDEFLRSNQVRKILKISSCELMHFRESGKLKFIRQGNAYLYYKSAINKLKQKE